MTSPSAERQRVAAAGDDDIFAAALSVESDAMAAGRREGKRDGMKQGYYEGREMGVKKGVELGREVAFYTACARTWTALAQAQPEALSSRAASSLQRLSAVLSSPSLASPLHASFFDALQTARTRYKQLLVHMRVQHCMRRQKDGLGDDEPDEGADEQGDEDETGGDEGGKRSQDTRDMRRIAQAVELSF